MTNDNATTTTEINDNATPANPVLIDPPVTIDDCRSLCYDAIANRQTVLLNYRIAKLAEFVGQKPKSADYIAKDDWKADVREWEERRAVAKDVFTFAEKNGCPVTDKYTVTGLKSGGVNFRHTRTIAFKPSGFKSRI